MKFLLATALLLAGCVAHSPYHESPVPSGMVRIAGSKVVLGSQDGEAYFCPPRAQYIDTFDIDRTEVTNFQYRQYKPEHAFPVGQEHYPVTHVTRSEAQSYLRSIKKRLPSAAEWEKAAGCGDGRLYPWGSDWNLTRANITKSGRSHGDFCSTTRMKAVGSFPSGASPYGCLDMCGNAWEWVSDLREGRGVIRGGAFGYRERNCRISGYATEDSGFT